MSIQYRPAVREKIPLLIGLAGGTGSGKTYSAMKLATGIAGGKRFAVCDTENGRAKHYADEFDFDSAELHAPFRPERYAEVIGAADKAGYPVVVVDSMSHEWDGEGGVLDWQGEEHKRLGGAGNTKLLSWQEPKSAHRRFVTRLLQVRAHVILCFRASDSVEPVKNPRTGKMEVVPRRPPPGLEHLAGWKLNTDARLLYELTLSFLLTADAPGVPKPIKLQAQHRNLVPLNRPLNERVGEQLAAWAAGGKATSDKTAELTFELLELADKLGKREPTQAAIAAHRADKSDRAHQAWLKKQIEAARRKAAEAEAAGDDLFAAAGEAGGS